MTVTMMTFAQVGPAFAVVPVVLLLVLMTLLLVALRYCLGSSLVAFGVLFSLSVLSLGWVVLMSQPRVYHPVVSAHEMRSHGRELRRQNDRDRVRVALRNEIEMERARIELGNGLEDHTEMHPPADAIGLPSPLARSTFAGDHALSAAASVEGHDVETQPDAATAESVADAETQVAPTAVEAEPVGAELEVIATESAAAASVVTEAADQEATAQEATVQEATARNTTGLEMPEPQATPAATAPSPGVAPTSELLTTAEPATEATTSMMESTAVATAPPWVLQPPDQVDGHFAVVLVSDPFEDRFGCDDDLERRTRAVIEEAARRRSRHRGLRAELAPRISIGYDEIDMVVRERHYQARTTSLGEMVQAYQLTVMNDAFQAKLDKRITDAIVGHRLATTGVFSGSVLLGVSLLFGVFRFAARKSPDPLRVG